MAHLALDELFVVHWMEVAGVMQQVQAELIGHVDARNALNSTKVSDIAPPKVC